MGRFLAVLPALHLVLAASAAPAAEPTRDDVLAAMKNAATYYREKVAVHGGYVYFSTPDLKKRWGEGVASPTQIWVQPPGTPTVGLAYIAAYRATGDKYYLDAAVETARALVYGQLKSGGWTNSIDFDSSSRLTAAYRNGKGKGRNFSTLDDGITQGALACLMEVDKALDFRDDAIHQAAKIGLDALLAAQFPNGGFPQGWAGPSPKRPVVRAKYPEYDWRTENRIKEYWNEYTLNDDLAGDVADTLIAAHDIYGDERAAAALRKLGDFLIIAQTPEPQPAWAQQYDVEMRPIWARKFEPPAVSGRESQDAIETLMKVCRRTNDRRYLEPIPRAIAWLKKSALPDGRLARYYELKTNTPLYMTTRYELTYDDSDVPQHYGWKVASHVERLEREFNALSQSKSPFRANEQTEPRPSPRRVEQIVTALDDQGRWMSTYEQTRLVGQPKFQPGERYLSSEVFSRNLTELSRYVAPER